MTLTPHQSLMLEAACDEVMAAGRLHRQRADQPLCTPEAKAEALTRYTLAVEYLGKLLRRLEKTHGEG